MYCTVRNVAVFVSFGNSEVVSVTRKSTNVPCQYDVGQVIKVFYAILENFARFNFAMHLFILHLRVQFIDVETKPISFYPDIGICVGKR